MKKSIKYFFTKIENLFLWSSGADLSILRQVPIEKNKFLGIGGTILFTALMASFAGGYAFFTAFQTIWISFFFGIFWGLLIFNLDRFIVSTFGSGDGKKTISKQELIEASPRLIMAILLGFVISTPLELKIFEKEIKLKIESLKIDKKEELIKNDSSFNANLYYTRSQITELKNQNDSISKNKTKLISNSVEFFVTRKNELIKQRADQQSLVVYANSKYEISRLSYNEAKNDSTGKYSATTINQRKVNRDKDYTLLNSEITKRVTIETAILDLDKNKGTAIDSEASRLDALINTNYTLLKNLQTKLNEMESRSDINQKNYKEISENYDGFAAHLEAMSELSKDKPILNFVRWLITLLFIFIETAPILFKMMTERGPYDDIFDRMKHEIKVRQLEIQSNINQEINTSVKIHTDKYEQKLNVELQANKQLLEEISKAQNEIAIVAINQWKEEQKAKMNEGASKIISSTN